MSEIEKKMLRLEEVMERLEMSRAEVYRTAKDGTLKPTKVDHVLQFDEEEVRQLGAKRKGERATFQEVLDHWLDLYGKRLGERGPLSETGTILGREDGTNSEGGDESDSDHAPSIGACARLFQA